MGVGCVCGVTVGQGLSEMEMDRLVAEALQRSDKLGWRTMCGFLAFLLSCSLLSLRLIERGWRHVR